MNYQQEGTGAPGASTGRTESAGEAEARSTTGDQAPPDDGQPAGDEGGWEARYREEQTKAEDYLTRWQRAQADMANLRRRNQQEREDYVKRANEELIRDLLPVLDSFDRALVTIPEELRQLTWIDGIMLVERQLRMALLRHGVTAIEAQGQRFDPTQHEAVAHKQTADHEDETVTAELQRGYRLHDRVLRPALVEVANNT